MKIVKTFTPCSEFPHARYCIRGQRKELGGFLDYLKVLPGQVSGEIITPPINPQLAIGYLGIDLEGENIGIATITKEQYRFFTGTIWDFVSKPIFQHPSIVEKGILQLEVSPLRFHLQIIQGGKFEKLRIAYEVSASLNTYLVEFALPWALSSIPVDFSRRTYSDWEGKVHFPEGFDLTRIERVFLKKPDALMMPATLNSSDRLIIPNSPLAPDTPVQILFTSRVAASKQGSDDAQLEYLPNIFVIPQDLTDATRVMQNFDVTRNFNLPVEVNITAQSQEDTEAIAGTIIHALDTNGRLYAPAFDLEFGLQVIGRPRFGVGGSISGALPSMRLSLLIRGIST